MASGGEPVKLGHYPALIASSVLLSTGSALAAGYALKEQGVSGLGNAYAGAAAVAEDPSTMFFNPAGLAKLRGNQVLGGASYIAPEAHFTNSGSTTPFGTAITGPNGGDAGQDAVLPHFYGMWDVNPNLKLGLAITSPYGLVTGYDDNWVGRYHAVTSKLATANIQPTIAYRVNDQLAVGAGFQAQYIKATLTSAVDFGTICLGSLPAATCGALGLSPQGADGHARLTGDDWGYGFSLGLLYEPIKSTRIGLAFRSKVEHTLKGDADFTVPTSATALTSTGRFRDTTVSGNVTTPESLSLSVVHDLNAQWSLLGDVTWTNWSRFKELRFRYGNTLQPDTVTPENWKDSYFFSLGATYRHTDAWTFRVGVAYDQTPVPDADRTARLPDNDRLWIAFGASYAFSQALKIDVGYTHIFINESSISNLSSTNHRQTGFYNNQIDILGVGMSYKF
ncbi:MAG: transporter [Alphaproteobacteria bacterium]|nr:transporter [Alphaproteobacteria bacterium]